MSDKLLTDLRGSFLRGLLIARQYIRKEAPIRSGNLRRASDFSEPVYQGSSIVSYLGIDNSQMEKKYGEYVVFGTGLYGPYKTLITPIPPGKALRFQIGNNTLFRKSVKGMQPNNYFKKGYEQGQTKIAEAIGQAARLLVVKEINSARGKNEPK